MALDPTEELPFTEDDLAPVEELLAELAAAQRGWVNFVPEVEPGHEPPPRSMVIGVFSARGAAVPLATWSAPERPGGRVTLGVEHGSGPQALDRLTGFDLAPADGWWKVSDHPRRGLVVTAPGEVDHGDALWWLLAAGHALSTVPLTGAWLARVYRGR